MADDTYILCGLAVVHPWLCDRMGHLTTRHYMSMFDDASYQLLAMLDPDADAGAAALQGWADVRHEIAYLDELRIGALIRVEARVSALGRTSVSAEYRMHRQDDNKICATMHAKTVCFDLIARNAVPLPNILRENAKTFFGTD